MAHFLRSHDASQPEQKCL